MASLFTSRRKPKRVGWGVDKPDEGDDDDTSPVVRKTDPKRGSKNKSKLRISFGPDQAENGYSDYGDGKSETSDKKPLGGPAKTFFPRTATLASRDLEDGRAHQSSRPTYNKDYLNELRNSTPSTPHNISSHTSEDDSPAVELAVSSQYGSIGEVVPPTSIPTEAEIREKKDRRSRLAQEQSFISLEEGNEGTELLSISKKNTQETRLVHEDEDIAEGFDDFVEDAGRVALGKKARAAQTQQERNAVRDMIAAAESETSDESDAEQNLAYQSVQTRSGLDGLDVKKNHVNEQPSIVTPIPRLSSVLERLRAKISSLEFAKAQLSKQMADLRQEKVEVSTRELNIQQLVREAGDLYEKLRLESAEAAKPDHIIP